MPYNFSLEKSMEEKHKSTQDTHNQGSSTPNGAQSGCNTKD
jgi:hypothetical protein